MRDINETFDAIRYEQPCGAVILGVTNTVIAVMQLRTSSSQLPKGQRAARKSNGDDRSCR